MSSWTDALDQAWEQVLHRDPYLMHIIWITIKVATIPTFIAVVVGLPLALTLGLGRFRGRGIGLVLANAGLGLPPVIVGLIFVMLTLPVGGPFAGLHVLWTLRGVYIVQTALALPVIVALSTASIQAVSPGLLDQARAFGAGRLQLSLLALREARVGILAAIIAAIGSALSEVGAVILAGANIQNVDQTLASAALFYVDKGDFVTGLAVGYVLLGLVIVVSGVLTFLQYRGAPSARIQRS